MGAHVLVGQVLAQRWEVRELIGEGEVARVFIGWDRRLSRSVVLKVLRDEKTDLARSFQQRAECAARLQHPNLVTVLDVDQDGGLPFVVLEYHRAQDVATLLRHSGRFSIERSLEIALAALDALGAAHAAGVMHGILCPSDLLIAQRGEVLVTNFGSTPSPLDPRVDVHAMGAVLYEMLCGKAPAEPPARLSTHGVSVPANLEAAIVKALQPNPQDRFESTAAFQQTLRGVLGNRGGNGYYSTDNNGSARVPSAPQETVVRSTTQPVITPLASATPPPLPEKPSHFPTLALILVLAIASATGLFYWGTSMNRVAVPTVLGLSEDVARHQLEKNGLRLVVREIQYNEQMQPGTIMSQVPDNHAQVHPGEAVTVVLSKGKQTVAIPNLSGMDRQDARQALEERGLEPKWSEELSEAVPIGLVISQEPHSGAVVDLRSQVRVAISKGPPQVTVPDVLGRTEKEGGDLISKAGLKVSSTTTRPSGSVPRGQVLEQKPAPRTRVDKGSQIEIVLSSGPDARTVPNLRGLTLRDARKKALAQGFQVGADGPLADTPTATVRDQYPEGGGVMQQGGNIHLSLEPAPSTPEPGDNVPTPNLVQMQLDVARITLEEQGFKLGNITPQESDQPQNTILKQTPAAGAAVKRGTSIDVIIAFPKTDKSF